MAFWSRKQSDFEEMHRIIECTPGINPTKLAKQLNVAPSTIQRRLPSMDESGFMLYEDDQGGLWPFGKNR